jgi:GntR family transcriptional regulator
VALDISVDVDSPVPPYEQIRRQIAAFVQGGLLAPGARLPAMRALAADLGVAVGTVARAYTELEAAGLVTSRRRTGTVVAEQAGRRPPTDASVQAAALELAARARASGLDEDAVLALVRAALVRTGAESAP